MKNKQSMLKGRLRPIIVQYTLKSKDYFRSSIRTAVNLSYKIIAENSTEIDDEEPTIFLLPGLLGNKKQWGGFAKTILNMTGRHLVALDLRNHGKSPHVNSHKYEEVAMDVIHLFEKLKINKATIIGHSVGGRTAMCVSLIAPEKVNGLIIIDISPVSTPKQMKDEFPKILTAMQAVDFKNSKKVNNARTETMKQLSGVVTDDLTMDTVLENVNLKPDGTIGWTCNLDIFLKHFKYIESFPSELKHKQYYGPTLFIGGQMSEFLPPDDLNSIRDIFPQAVITYIPKTGHNVHLDDLKTFLELTISFIKAHN